MRSLKLRRTSIALLGVAALALPLAACSSDGGSSDGKVELSFLSSSGEDDVARANAIIEAFMAENPDITVTLETQPGGTEGDNLMKTRLSTGEMADVFYYNSGSLFQALNPDQTLVPLTDESWAGDIDDTMKATVSTDNGLYGAPVGTSMAGAMLYNKAIYAELGLEVPTSWDEFASNNEAIKASGKDAVIQTYGDTWTSQLFVLGDFANVYSQDEEWPSEYTANNRTYSDEPAFQGFANLQEGFESEWWNEDFASAVLDDGLRMLATGEGAHYPILTNSISTIEQNYPDAMEDIGVFAIPAQNAADTKLTVWLPFAVYIPTTTEGEKLEAAKKLVAFYNTPAGCEAILNATVPSGPFVNACELPDDVPTVTKDLQAYFDEGATAPALEFLSPIKGPNLENITVEVGSGIRSAEEGAKLYDEDVEKQAQQLGLEGW